MSIVLTHVACQPTCEEGEEALVVMLFNAEGAHISGATVTVVDAAGELSCEERVTSTGLVVYDCLPSVDGEAYVVVEAFGYEPLTSDTVLMSSVSCYGESLRLTLTERSLDVTAVTDAYTVELMPGSGADTRLLSFSASGDLAGFDATVLAGASYASIAYDGPGGVEYLDLLLTLRDVDGNELVYDRQCVEPACEDTELDVFADAIEHGLCASASDCAADLQVELSTDRPLVDGERLTVVLQPSVTVDFVVPELTDAEPVVDLSASVSAL